MLQILGLLGMYFDAVIVIVTNFSFLFRLALAILWSVAGGNKRIYFERKGFAFGTGQIGGGGGVTAPGPPVPPGLNPVA